MTEKTNQVYTNTSVSTDYHLHIFNDIAGPESLEDHFQVLRQAGENDTVHLHINSVGGSVYTAVQYIAMMSACKAPITAHVEGQCYSAATFIFLAADRWVINPLSTLMFHNYTSGYWGSGDDPLKHHEAVKILCHRTMDTFYTGFLTEEEIQKIKTHNDTIWITGDEGAERIQNYCTYLAELDKETAAKAAENNLIDILPNALDNPMVVKQLSEHGYVKLELQEQHEITDSGINFSISEYLANAPKSNE